MKSLPSNWAWEQLCLPRQRVLPALYKQASVSVWAWQVILVCGQAIMQMLRWLLSTLFCQAILLAHLPRSST